MHVIMTTDTTITPDACRGFFCTFQKADLFRRCLVLVFAAVFMAFGLAACKNDKQKTRDTIRFAVVADPHLYDTALGASGPDFESYVEDQVKMTAQSEAVFIEAARMIMEMEPKPAFLLIPGDLTKDGEEESHRLMADHLHRIKDSGIAVFVVPGNHDIDNPEAAAYGGFGSVPVYSPKAGEFADIYAPFGYDQAIYRDRHSLSYIAEPAAGLWLFAIDTCRYEENTDLHVIGGLLKAETLEWLLIHLEEAREKGKTVIAMMHHGLVEHLIGHGAFIPEALIEDWDAIGRKLASAGMNVIFTGHYHTQNITRRRWDPETFIVEIQTGSLVNYPVPLRVVDFDMGKAEMDVQSLFVKDIPREQYPDEFCCFAAFAKDFSYTHKRDFAVTQLTDRYDLTPAEIEWFATMLTDATMAHFAGDEAMPIEVLLEIFDHYNSGNPDVAEIAQILISLYSDLPPQDNDAVIRLKP